MGWNRIMSSEHQNGIVTGDGTQTEQALRASELSYRRLFETAEDGILIQDVDKKAIQCNIRDIPERKRAKAVLRESEQRFEALFEGAREGVFQSTLGGQFRLANPALARMLGYASSQELIAGVTDIGRQLNVDTGVRAEFQRRITERGEVQDFEFQARRKDGATIWLSENAHAVRDASGAVLYYEGMLQDITERKQAEELLHHEQTLMATLMGNIPDGVYFKDTASRFLRVNSAQSRKFGLSDPAQIVGKSDADFFSGEHARQALADEQEIIRTGRPLLNVEEKETWPDGTVGWVLTTKLPMRDAAGRIIGTCGISRDITGRKRAEEAVRESERRFQTLANTSPVGIFRTDAQGQTTYVNPRWCQITGLSATDALGDRWLHAVHPEDREKLVQGWQAATQVQSTSKADYRFVHPDGTISWVIGQAVPEKDDAGRIVGYVGTVTDITERKRADEALRESQALYHTLVEQMPAGVFRKDRAGRYVFANSWFCQLRGLEADQIVGRTPDELVAVEEAAHSQTRPEILQLLRDGSKHHEEILRTGEPIQVEEVYPTAGGGKRYLHVVKSAVFGSDGQIVGTQGIQFDVTERKQAEAALEESRQMLRSILDTIPVSVFWKDTEGRYLGCNQPFARDAGFDSPEQLTGKNDHDMAWKDHADLYRADDQQVIASGVPKLQYEEPQTTSAGAQLWLRTSKIPLRDAEGRIIGVLGTYEDITERKQAEKALNYERDLWRELLDNTPDHIYFKDTQSRFIKSSKALALQFGVESPDEMVGKTDFDFFTEAHARPAYEDEQEIIRTGRPMIAKEEREVWRDGHITWASSTKMPLRDGTGKIIGIMGISRDITERKQAEEKLKLFRLLIERSNDAIEVVDSATGRFLDANESGCRALGYTRDELLSLTVFDLMPEVNRALFDATNAQIKRAGHATLETLRRRKDGMTYPVEVSLSSVTLDREYTVAIVRDITERRKLEAQFRQAQKMEAIGQLAGGVAHDFNNILGVIIGYGDLITEDLEPDSPLRKYVEEIRHAAVRATGLTQQLLVFSRKKKVQLVVLDLNDTVKNLDKMLRRLIGENIEMMVVPGKEIGRIKADTGYIGQVLMNLAVNARDAMPNGGKLTIATDNVTLDENYTRTHTGIIPGDYVMLTVSDTGTGMTKEVKARLFEALFTTKPAGKGTGLGLATCQTIVQQSGGHIDVVSEVGKGTTFKIYFPRVDKPVEVVAGADQTGTLPRGTETLLIVEDEPSVRHLAWKVLEALGYHVLRANDGQDALQMVREHKGSPIRLVVTDVIMPRMGGKVMADWLKTTDPDLKVLFTSGYTDDAIAKHGVLEPGIAFLSKPYTPGILARKVRAMLDNETDTSILLKQCVTVNQSQ